MSLYYPQAALVLKPMFDGFERGARDDIEVSEADRVTVIARDVRVEINDYTQANQFDCEIEYKEFPFDPRTIRAMVVSVHIDNILRLQDGPNPTRIKPTQENAVFVGYVDEAEIDFDNSSRVVKLKGRDQTALFLDTNVLRPVPTIFKDPLNVTLQQVLNQNRIFNRIRIVKRFEGAWPNPAKFTDNNDSNAAGVNPKKGENYWELINRIVSQQGLVAYMEINNLIIARPRNLFNEPDRTYMIYGYNVSKLSFKRRIGKAKDFNVLALSYTGKQKIQVSIPAQANDPFLKNRYGNKPIMVPQLDENGKKIGEKIAEPIAFAVKEVSDKNQLISIAEGIFYEASRQQIEGRLETFEMELPRTNATDSGPRNQKIPVWGNTMVNVDGNNIRVPNIRIGTPINIVIDQQDFRRIESVADFGARKQYLLLRGYEENVAIKFAETLGKAAFTFYTRSIEFKMSSDNGFEMMIDFVNFIDSDQRALGNE